MAKKRLISSLLLCVFAIIFVHSVVPHHHEEEAYAHHQTSPGDDHDDIEDNFLGHTFSHFQHDQGGTIVYEAGPTESHCTKVKLDKETVLLVQYILQVIHKPPVEFPVPHLVRFSSYTSTSAKLLRGPPAVAA